MHNSTSAFFVSRFDVRSGGVPAVSGACIDGCEDHQRVPKRSGSTAETMQVHDYSFVPMN
jgi:hypothetical protein